nr:reverse transcriptase domain-containing protein [Tanacetum cinerariifolium]
MSAMANTTPLVTTVTKPATNPRDVDNTPRVNIQEFCEEYYEDILPIIMDKVRQDRRKDVHTRLDFGEGLRERTREDSHHSSARARTTKPERVRVQDCLRYGNRHVFDRLGHRRKSAFDRLSETYSPSTTKSRPRETDFRDPPRGRSNTHGLNTSIEDRPKDRERFRSIGESYDDSFSRSYRNGNRSRHMKRRRDNGSPLSSVSKSDSSDERCRRTRMPKNVKTYDGTGDPKDHVKNFQAATQVERWAMPTWCHMFNSTLIGAARVWFGELPPESIDSYKDLKATFLAYFMQQKKYVKDPVEIHNIKQRDGETVEDFMERFKVETGRMKGAPECMRISGFMHEVDNPEGIKPCLDKTAVVLQLPSPRTIKEFAASYNEAEYEALITGLRIAARMGVKDVHVCVDSKLVANQVLGTYVAKEDNMVKEGCSNGDRGRWTDLDDTDSGLFKRRNSPRRQEGGKKASPQGPTIRINGGNSLQVGVPYAVVKMRWIASGGIHRPITRSPQQPLTPITALCSFYKWGIDIAGPIPEGPGKVKFLIVAMDYFTKWIEAKAVATITGGQSNGLIERVNRSLGEGIKSRLGEGNKNWVEELPHVLCTHRTMIKSSHGDTPFSITYGTEAVIPTKIGMPTYRTAAVDVVSNDEELPLNLDLLEERRERAAICEAKAKSKMTKYYNAQVRGITFKPGDFFTAVMTLVTQ